MHGVRCTLLRFHVLQVRRVPAQMRDALKGLLGPVWVWRTSGRSRSPSGTSCGTSASATQQQAPQVANCLGRFRRRATYIYIHIYTRGGPPAIYIHMYTCTYVYIYITYTHGVGPRPYMYIYICIHIYMYTHIHPGWAPRCSLAPPGHIQTQPRGPG